MFAAAGIVVTETRTPIRAPDFAEVSESIPASAGDEGDDERERVGLGDEVGERVVGDHEDRRGRGRCARSTSANRQRGDDPDREPDRERAEPTAGRRRAAALDDRDAEPGDRPELRADDHRADDQDRRVEKDARPTAIRQASAMNARKLAVELRVLRRPRLDLLPDHGVARVALRGALGRCRGRSRSRSRCARSRSSPRVSTSSSRRSETMTLASSRATSQRITSPSGLRAARSR